MTFIFLLNKKRFIFYKYRQIVGCRCGSRLFSSLQTQRHGTHSRDLGSKNGYNIQWQPMLKTWVTLTPSWKKKHSKTYKNEQRICVAHGTKGCSEPDGVSKGGVSININSVTVTDWMLQQSTMNVLLTFYITQVPPLYVVFILCLCSSPSVHSPTW